MIYNLVKSIFRLSVGLFEFRDQAKTQTAQSPLFLKMVMKFNFSYDDCNDH